MNDSESGRRVKAVVEVYVRKGDDELERFLSINVSTHHTLELQETLLGLGMVFDGNTAIKRIGGDSRYTLFRDLRDFEVALMQTLNEEDYAVSFK